MSQSTPDYYRILQVHPEAEQDVIEAAYHRLMRKYHPDILDPEERDNPETQKLVRMINEAYSILSDPFKRNTYDEAYRPDPLEGFAYSQEGAKDSNFEKIIVQARCSKTRVEFQIILARKRGSLDKLRVVGFNSPDLDHSIQARTINQFQPVLEQLIVAILGADNLRILKYRYGWLSNHNHATRVDEAVNLDFTNILWTGHVCPVCSGEQVYERENTSSWAFCGKCSKISCTGGSMNVKNLLVKTCPWCGSFNRGFTGTPPGSSGKYDVRGSAVQVARNIRKENLEIPEEPNKALPE